MKKPAARVTDNHSCPKHGGGPIIPPCDPTDKVNGLAQARATDKARCPGPIDIIVTGSSTVRVHGKPAARATDKCMHGGEILPPCSPDVKIGGAPIGVTLGNPRNAERDCRRAARGRNPPRGALDPSGRQIPRRTVAQSYNNCGVETSRLMINRARRSAISQETLLNTAMNNGFAGRGATLYASGGTNPGSRVNILNGNGVPASQTPYSIDAVAQAVAEGRGANVVVSAGVLWNDPTIAPGVGDHVVNVSAVQFDANGQVSSVTIVDTGTGQCRQVVSAADWARATSTTPAWNMVTTNRPIY
jgi:uncharacterized Zn-binding protein involved in type VI secretion